MDGHYYLKKKKKKGDGHVFIFYLLRGLKCLFFIYFLGGKAVRVFFLLLLTYNFIHVIYGYVISICKFNDSRKF